MKKFDSDRVKIKQLSLQISGVNDIISRFSSEGFELLSPSFLSFIDLTCPEDSDKSPILLRIIGAGLSEEQQRRIDDAIWLHYRLRMTSLAKELKTCRIKILWFLICTALSSAFLYLIPKQLNEVALQLFYLPIWFFGYRLLTFPFQNYLPLRRQLLRCRRLAVMKLIFSEDSVEAIPDELMESVYQENAIYYDKAMEGIRTEQLTRMFMKEDGTAVLSCRANNAKDLINPCTGAPNEMISCELASFFNQADSFVNPRKPVELQIKVDSISAGEREEVTRAFRNYEKCRLQHALSALKDSNRKIWSYMIGLAFACAALYLFAGEVSPGIHEFLLIGLWFFADYLVEFILLEHADVKYMVRHRQCMMKSDITFTSLSGPADH